MPDLPLAYIIGDSISIQYGPFLERFLEGTWRYDRKRGETEALLNLDNPQGANGGDSSMVADFLRGLVKEEDFRPDLLLVNCGAHDIKTDPASGKIQIPLSEYERNLREIIALAGHRGIPMAWIRSAPISEEIHNSFPVGFHRFNADFAAHDQAACRIMTQASIPIADLFTFTRNLGTDAELFCDHAHFQDNIREKQAAFLAGWLNARHP